MKRFYWVLAVIMLSSGGIGGYFYMQERTQEKEVESWGATLKPQPTFEIPVMDGPNIIGRMEFNASILFPSARALAASDRNWYAVEEAQIMALQDYVNLRVDPRRPVDVETIADILEKTLASKGYNNARVLVQSVQVYPG